jgi:H+/Cl- antiporter ClcA
VRLAPRLNPAFLLYLGEMLLFVFIFAIALKMLSVARAKTRDLIAQSRGRELLYWTIPIVLAAVLLVWLLLRHRLGRQ